MTPYRGLILPFAFIALAALLIERAARSGLWMLAAALAFTLLIGWAGRRFGWRWLPSVLLVVYLAAAALVVLAGGSPLPPVVGVAAALVGWELAERHLRRPAPAGDPSGAASARAHFLLLAACAGIGLLFALGGFFLRIPVQFGGVVLAGLLVLYSLYQVYRAVLRS